MIDNIVPCLKQSEVDLSSKLLQLFERRKVKEEDIHWRSSPFQVGIETPKSYQYSYFGPLSPAVYAQHTPPNSRTPSPRQGSPEESVFPFDMGLPSYHRLNPITPPPCTPFQVPRDSYSPPMTSICATGLCTSPVSSSSDVTTNLFQDPTWSPAGRLSSNSQTIMDTERKPVMRLEAVSASTEPTYTWSNQLPPRIYKNPIYSSKVFLGGVPWDITEAGLQQAFKPFGQVKVEWPGKEGKQNRHPPKGYVYLLFESEKSVKALLMNCTHDYSNGGDWYYKISSRRMRCKEVQVIPWVLSDSNFARNVTQKLDSSKTVFVGGLHGMINAEALATIMNDLFDGVIYAGIDTDKHKYPIGSGRVTFNNTRSFMKAVQAAFIEIRTPKFTKKVQIDPYLEDSMCSTCRINPGPFFCRDPECFRYFCRSCWGWHHSIASLKMHKPITRSGKNTTTTTPSPSTSF